VVTGTLAEHCSLVLGLLLRLEAVGSDLLVILLESSQVLAGLGEFTLFHTLTNVPVNEGALAVHEIELVVKSRPGLGDGSGVGQHGDGALDRRETTVLGRGRNGHGLLVVDAELETGRAPLDEVEGGLGLESSNSSAAVAGNNVTAVEQSNSHVLAVAGVANDHLVVGLKALEGDIVDAEALVLALGSGNDRGVRDERVVDTRVWHQVGLELVQVDVQGTVESERRGDRGDDLSDETVQVLVGGTGDVEVAAANVVDSLVVDQEGTVGVLDGGVGGENSVVRLNDSSRDAGSRVHGELELGLLAVLGRKTLEEKSTKTGTSSTTEGVEDQEALERLAVVGDTADTIHDIVDHLLANGIVATSVVVGSILFAADQHLRVEEGAVAAGADLVDGGGVEIDEERTGDMLAAAGLSEEGLKRARVANVLGVGVRTTISAEAMLQKVELPGRVTQLGTSLADVEVKNLALHCE